MPIAATPAAAAKTLPFRESYTEFEDLTPSEKIAIKAAARAAYKAQQVKALTVCADPGNMPLSNEKQEGFENKMALMLGEAMGAQVNFFWRPSTERGLTRQTFDAGMCDVMIDVPANYEDMLTTFPVFRTTYVLAYRNDKGLDIKSLDDPKLKDLKIGVYQKSGIRQALVMRGIFANVELQTVSHNADLVPENQPWELVRKVVDGKLDIAAVWGPFAGWVKTMKGEPITIVPVNLMEDRIPLEFSLAIGVRKTDVLLKYMLELALDDKKVEIEKLLRDYGVPLVQCANCIVQGDLPSHGSYTDTPAAERKPRPDLLPPDQVVTQEKLENWLAEGADLNQELSNAIIANDAARVKFLVGKGADVNKPDSQGWTPLATAARDRNSDMMKVLVDLKADVNKADPDGNTPLLLAVMQDHVPSIKVLLDAHVDTEGLGPEGYRPLAVAIVEDKYEAAKALVDGGAKVNVPGGPEAITPLMEAAAQKAPALGAVFLPDSTRPVDVGRALLEHGADINAKSTSGITPLMVAATHNNAPMIGLLIEAGADGTAKNNEGKTAHDLAVLNGNLEAAQAILVLSAVPPTNAAASPANGSGSTSQ